MVQGFVLNNGVEMPAVGLGTYPMHSFDLVKAVIHSVKFGYRLFDTSSAYNNERALGLGIKLCRKQRADLFITTKLSNTQQREGNVKQALFRSLRLMRLDYVDLYLMHWPNPETFIDSWKQMEVLYKQGYCRAIGVCNFHDHHFDTLLPTATVIPAVNQVELHPLLSQKPLTEYCKAKGILVEAYSPIARMSDKLFANNLLQNMSSKYNKSIVQLILRWNYQNGIVSIPKTSNKARLESNISIFDFEITEQDMLLIDSVNENHRVRFDPDNCDFTKL